MIVAFAIGIAFGVALECAGLGSARKLAGQFYFTDFTVFKVMFSAIVTAMLGAFWLDLQVFVPETWLVPQLVGGLVFGAGFVIAGLCPGTSCVATATGRLDGLFVIAGMFTGVLVTGLALPARFYESTARGTLTLPEVLRVSPGVVVCAIVIVALVAFRFLDREPRSLQRNFAAIALLLGIAAPFARTPDVDVKKLATEIAREEDHVTAIELAHWIRDRKPNLRIVDLRTQAEFDEFHIPRSERVALDALLATRFAPSETIVLISDGGAHAAQSWVLLRASGTPHVYFLRGGLGEWIDDVMNPVNASPDVAALSRYFGGVPRKGDATSTKTSVATMKRRGC